MLNEVLFYFTRNAPRNKEAIIMVKVIVTTNVKLI